MASELSASTASTTKPPSTASLRIADLNAISVSISELLSHASSAIRLLTTADASPAAPNRTDAFAKHSAEYHALLSSITVRLRRQILLLEAAEIPLPVDDSEGVGGAAGGVGGGGAGAGGGAAGSAGGGIDVGALNERNDVVGREMERELWRRAREFLRLVEEGGADGMEVLEAGRPV